MPWWRPSKAPMSDGPSPTRWTDAAARAVLRDIFDAAVASADPGAAVRRHLPEKPQGRCVVVGAGKGLLASGAGIVEMNAVRKHLSAIKGGRLARAAHPARVVTLAISDIPGDDPAAIASGPTVADASTLADVHEIIARYKIDLPPAAQAVLAECEETPKSLSAQNSVRVIAAPSLALAAAAHIAAKARLAPPILGDAIEGQRREVGVVLAGMWPFGPLN